MRHVPGVKPGVEVSLFKYCFAQLRHEQKFGTKWYPRMRSKVIIGDKSE